MYQGKRVLAVVPARSGSKGIPDKNMRLLAGVSLIGHAGRVLGGAAWLDARVLSTDSPAYAEEGRRHGLDAFFLRPPELSDDAAGAVDTMIHALRESEGRYATSFDVILIVEPTSPLREVSDLEACVRRLVEEGADSAVTVSPLSAKSHPAKILRLEGCRLDYYLPEGKGVVGRQALGGGLCWRNGLCYALTRRCLAEQRAIITDRTIGVLTERPVVNIDEPIELEWAEFLLARKEDRRTP